MPDAPERLTLWKRMLGFDNTSSTTSDNTKNDTTKTKPIHNDINEQDLAGLAERLDITGGDIRNALFSAHLYAAEDGGVLSMRHLVLGAWRELQKSGRMIDIAQFGPWQKDIERYN